MSLPPLPGASIGTNVIEEQIGRSMSISGKLNILKAA